MAHHRFSIFRLEDPSVRKSLVSPFALCSTPFVFPSRRNSRRGSRGSVTYLEPAALPIPGLTLRRCGKGCEISGTSREKTSRSSFAALRETRPDAKPRHRARSTQGRCPCRPDCCMSDPCSQAGDQDYPHCHGDSAGSGCDRASR